MKATPQAPKARAASKSAPYVPTADDMIGALNHVTEVLIEIPLLEYEDTLQDFIARGKAAEELLAQRRTDTVSVPVPAVALAVMKRKFRILGGGKTAEEFISELVESAALTKNSGLLERDVHDDWDKNPQHDERRRQLAAFEATYEYEG